MCLFFLIIILRIFFADDFTFVYNHISPYFPKPFLFTVQTKKILSGAHAPRSCLLTFRQSRAVLHRMVKLLTKHPRLCEPPSTNTNSSKPSYFYPGSAKIYSRKIDSTTFHPRRNICTTTAPAQKKPLPDVFATWHDHDLRQRNEMDLQNKWWWRKVSPHSRALRADPWC